jgi:CelD/BcsL family acetyltransferase involved in cellulose biosynthesis
MYTTRIVDSVSQISSLESDWNELLAHSSNATVFNTYGWAWCWLQIYWQQDYALKIILVESGAELVALLPLYIQKTTGTCWFVGSGEPEAEEVASEYLDFIVHQDHAGSAELADCIKGKLDALKPYRLNFVNCCASSYVENLLRGHPRALFSVSGAVYKLAIQNSFADTALTFSKNQLKNARQCLNRFNAAPELEYVSFHSCDFSQNWQTLQTLHQKDWTSRGNNGAFHSPKFSRFHALMHTQQPQIRQAFVALRKKDEGHNNETLAIHHFYVFNGHYYFYLAGTEKNTESRLSPGLMLHVLAMQELSGEMATYDFLKGTTSNSYKEKFCGTGEAFYTITVFEPSVRGNLQHWLARLKLYVRTVRKPASDKRKSGKEE